MALIFCFIDLALMGAAAFNSNSVTILGDLLKETTDTLSVLAAFLTVRAVRRSPGQRFAYGVGKLENLVSVSIGVIMVACALFVTVARGGAAVGAADIAAVIVSTSVASPTVDACNRRVCGRQ